MWWHTGRCIDSLQGPFYAPSVIEETPNSKRGRSFKFLRPLPTNPNGKSPRTPRHEIGEPAPCPSLQKSARCQLEEAEGAEKLLAFKRACVNRYHNMARAWRMLLDPDCVGRISYVPFHRSAKIMGFHNVQQLWSAIDADRSGFMTLDEWDSRTFRHLVELRDICYREYGGIEHAFMHGMDRTGSRTVTLAEMARFCKTFGFTGEPTLLFAALDLQRDGYLTVDDLDILDSCVGERFGERKCRFVVTPPTGNTSDSLRAAPRGPRLTHVIDHETFARMAGWQAMEKAEKAFKKQLGDVSLPAPSPNSARSKLSGDNVANSPRQLSKDIGGNSPKASPRKPQGLKVEVKLPTLISNDVQLALE